MRMTYSFGPIRTAHQIVIDEFLAARRDARRHARTRDARPARRLTIDAAPTPAEVEQRRAQRGQGEREAERADEVALLPPGSYELREAGDRVEIYDDNGEFVMALPAGDYDGRDDDEGLHIVKKTAVKEAPSVMPYSSGEQDHVTALRDFNSGNARRVKPSRDVASSRAGDRGLLLPLVGVGNASGPQSLATFNRLARKFWENRP